MQHIQEIGRQHSYAAPPINNQQNFSRPPIGGQQSVNHSQVTNFPGAPSSQVSPSLSMGSHGHGQSSAEYPTQVVNSANANLAQSGIGMYNSAPSSQTGASVTGFANPTGLAQFEPRQFAPPLSTTGQFVASPPGTSFPQVRQKQYLQTAPPMSGQTVASPAGPGLLQSGQRQYGSTAPPLPGQTLSTFLGMNRASSATTSSYQQPTYQQPGYHNQMVQL